MMNDLALLLQLSVQMGTPLLFGTLGGILNEKVGHLNLGIEGMMLLGASFGFSTAYRTGNVLLAIISAGLAGAIGALIYAVLTVTFRSDQTVTGFALTIFGVGVSNFAGKSLSNQLLSNEFISVIGVKQIPYLSKIPFIGTIIFHQSFYVHIALVAAIMLYIYMKKTRPGLNMYMVGEDPAAADASGINVTAYKYAHILIGGALCGLGGAFLSLVYVPRWQDNITAGMGWICVALVIFSTWNPLKAILGAYLFGLLRSLSIKYQNVSFFGLIISPQIIDMLPYLMTILVLIFTTLSQKRENLAPGSLGKPYFREDR